MKKLILIATLTVFSAGLLLCQPENALGQTGKTSGQSEPPKLVKVYKKKPAKSKKKTSRKKSARAKGKRIVSVQKVDMSKVPRVLPPKN